MPEIVEPHHSLTPGCWFPAVPSTCPSNCHRQSLFPKEVFVRSSGAKISLTPKHPTFLIWIRSACPIFMFSLLLYPEGYWFLIAAAASRVASRDLTLMPALIRCKSSTAKPA